MLYKHLSLFIGLVAAFALAGCGDEAEQQDAAAVDGQKATVAGSGGAHQEAAVKTSRKCPAAPASTRQPDGAPVDDIVGIRPGMTYDDVSWVLECRDDVPVIETAAKWHIKQTYDFPIRQLVRASNGTPCTGQEIVRGMGAVGSKSACDDGGYRFRALKNITREFDVVFTGMPGEEKAGGVWRRNAFAEGESPAIATLVQSLSDKYGAAHVTEKDRQGRTHLMWIYDLLGRPMSRASKDFNGCKMRVNASFAAGQGWSAGCGLTIKAAIAPVYGNDLLAREMTIGVLHQKNFYEDGQKFERDLAAANEQRKREEAAKSGASPDL